MTYLKKILSNKDGASSVLVIFMLLVLVTLGALAITSANSNFRLSLRAREWSDMYYGLDSKGEEFLAALDLKLAMAEAKVGDYIEAQGYAAGQYEDIPSGIQITVFNEYAMNSLKNPQALSNIYMFYADEYLKELTEEFSDLQLYTSSSGELIDVILAEISFKSEKEVQSSLNVALWVSPIAFELEETNGKLAVSRASNELRYEIEDWYEYQEPLNKGIEEEPVIELWDGQL